MELVEKLILWIVLSGGSNFIGFCFGGTTVSLNGPPIETSDLRAIDGYVSSGLPLFASTKGFLLHSGNRPVFVKVKDPNKEIRDGIEQPNPSYYRNLPSVIPEGYEGIATTSFLLGHPIGTPVSHQAYPSQLFGNIPQQQQPQQFGNFQQEQQQQPQQYIPQQQQPQQYIPQQQQPMQYQQYQSNQIYNNNNNGQQQQQQQQPQQQLAEPSIRVENKIQPEDNNGNNQVFDGRSNGVDANKLTTNPVVVETSAFEANLPHNLQNPFYSNQELAYTLARESLPLPGEEVVGKWDTNKIRVGRIRDLLLGAGFIS